MEKKKGGASRPRPHFWPAGRSRPSPPALAPFPAPAPAPRPRVRTAAPRRRGTPAELGRHVARMRRLGRTLVGHQVRPVASAFAPAARRAPPLALSLSLACAQQPLRRSPLPPTLGALLLASSGLLPPIHNHQRLRLAFPHPTLTLNRVR